MTDDEAETQFVNSILEGIQAYIQAIEREQLPGGRTLVFLAVAGCRRPDGTAAIKIICNAGDDGREAIIAELEREQRRRRRRPE
jgi:hypothetical protein